MMPTKPDLVILPFKATLPDVSLPLTLEQTLSLLRKHVHVQIERSQPGALDAIGWTIFRRTPRKYLYENEPLFRFERGARRYIRKAYAIHYSLLGDDGMTHSHLHL
ncbi:MAG: hypothetical protein QY306_03945 [Anaerolineales bacterium]|nr:MAG: hypothetical protein QY306_03945 [Anaerolineales bacterium]